MSVGILGTNCDQCRSTVLCCFTSTETVRLFRMESPGRPPRLSHSSWTMSGDILLQVLLSVLGCRLTYQGQAETSALAWFNIALRPRKPEGSLGRTAQDGHLHSHTAPELCGWYGDSVAIGIIISLFPHFHTPLPPFSPSLMSLMVSVDVKYHVYITERTWGGGGGGEATTDWLFTPAQRIRQHRQGLGEVSFACQAVSTRVQPGYWIAHQRDRSCLAQLRQSESHFTGSSPPVSRDQME